MKAVRHLRGVRGSLARSLGISAPAVSRQHLDARMSAQPSRQSHRRAVLQKIHNLVSLEVHQDGAVGLAASTRPIVDPQDARGRTVGHRVGAHYPKDRRPTSFQPPSSGETSTTRSSRLQAVILKRTPLHLGPPRLHPNEARETLGEDAPRAAQVGAAEAPGLEAQTNRTRSPRQIGKGPLVMAVDAR